MVDWRAVADADQAGQLDNSGEAKTPRALRTLEPPTDTARMLYNMTHVPFRDCVAILRGKSSKKFATQTSCGKQDSGHSAQRSRQTPCSYVLWLRAEHGHTSRSCETRSGAVIRLHVRKGKVDTSLRGPARNSQCGDVRNAFEEVSITDVCRKVATREKGEKCATFRPKDESPGAVVLFEAVL